MTVVLASRSHLRKSSVLAPPTGFHGIEISLPEMGEYSLTAADSFLSHPFSLRSTPSPSGEGRGEGLRPRIGATFQKASKASPAWQH